MKKYLFVPLILTGTVLMSCSSNDDSSPTGANANSDLLIGKWVIKKAIYEGATDTTYYEYNLSCGREVLEFNSNRTVEETIYIDSDCQNGAGTEFQWWTNGSGFRMGYQDSDATMSLSISGSELYMDGLEEWGYRKYYQKVE